MDNKIGIPGAIIIAGLLIAGAVVFAFTDRPQTVAQNKPAAAAAEGIDAPEGFRLPDESDHTNGPADAEITIIEYSDIECPYCARFHPVLAEIVSENPNVKTVYRHFPLNSIHANATPAAIASECVATLAGEDAFFSFLDTMFADQASLSAEFYTATAVTLGIDADAFAACQADSNVLAQVNEDLTEVTSLGGRGTPFSIIVTPDNKLIPFSGVVPKEAVQEVLEQI